MIRERRSENFHRRNRQRVRQGARDHRHEFPVQADLDREGRADEEIMVYTVASCARVLVIS
jgi:hypothetical protein